MSGELPLPPLGIEPEWAVLRLRCRDLCAAIDRYLAAPPSLPLPGWSSELERNILRLREIEPHRYTGEQESP